MVRRRNVFGSSELLRRVQGGAMHVCAGNGGRTQRRQEDGATCSDEETYDIRATNARAPMSREHRFCPGAGPLLPLAHARRLRVMSRNRHRPVAGSRLETRRMSFGSTIGAVEGHSEPIFASRTCADLGGQRRTLLLGARSQRSANALVARWIVPLHRHIDVASSEPSRHQHCGV
jgi:hypothetical protein